MTEYILIILCHYLNNILTISVYNAENSNPTIRYWPLVQKIQSAPIECPNTFLASDRKDNLVFYSSKNHAPPEGCRNILFFFGVDPVRVSVNVGVAFCLRSNSSYSVIYGGCALG